MGGGGGGWLICLARCGQDHAGPITNPIHIDNLICQHDSIINNNLSDNTSRFGICAVNQVKKAVPCKTRIWTGTWADLLNVVVSTLRLLLHT